ncbi:Uncharacterised protein [Acinetobacter baumannii]|nr:Uncharacterised protein [Acinetobacter baumannii]
MFGLHLQRFYVNKNQLVALEEPRSEDDEINSLGLYKPKYLKINLLRGKSDVNQTYYLLFLRDTQPFFPLNTAFEYLEFHRLPEVQPYKH